MKKFLFLLLVSSIAYAQTPPPPQQEGPEPSIESSLGQLQNNTGQVQSNSFNPPNMGGSKVRPNPFMQTADFAFIQNPTFEGGWRNGFSYGFSKSNLTGTSSFGANGLFTTDFTQRAISVYKSVGNRWYYSYVFARMGTDESTGGTITRIWHKGSVTSGAQIGLSRVHGEEYRIISPSFVYFINKSFDLGGIVITPELYNTFSNWYYNKDEGIWESDFTYNALVGSTFSFKLTKRFLFNFSYRGNINTNPKFGLMNNFFMGSNFKF